MGWNLGSNLSPDQMRRLLDICDPASTGLISIEYLVSLVQQHCTKEEAKKTVETLDPKGRGVLTYKEFFGAVNTLLRKSGGGAKEMLASGRRGLEESYYQELLEHEMPLTTSHSNEKLNSQCSSMSEGESYECYGEVDMDNNLTSGDPMQRSPNNSSSPRRNTWLRTSFRRTANNHDNLPNRKWGSFRNPSGKRLAGSNPSSGGLHRSSSFTSSGKSSNCDAGEDVYSDVSLEDVYDLNHKVQMLQQQMNALAENQINSDDRYTRAKQENATLQARVHMLEEQLREVEVRSEERLADEERRHRELVARVDREKQLQVENCAIRLQKFELENSSLRDEAQRCRTQVERLRLEKDKLEEQVRESEGTVVSLKEEVTMLRDQERKNREKASSNKQLIEELTMEGERLRNEWNKAIEELSSRNSGVPVASHEELQAQFSAVRDENKRLQEAHDEMQALLLTRSVEEGRNLLTGNQSLAAELEAMTQDELEEVRGEEMKIRSTLKEQQEVNAQLRAYIDGILLNIVENYPQLLEVKANPS